MSLVAIVQCRPQTDADAWMLDASRPWPCVIQAALRALSLAGLRSGIILADEAARHRCRQAADAVGLPMEFDTVSTAEQAVGMHGKRSDVLLCRPARRFMTSGAVAQMLARAANRPGVRLVSAWPLHHNRNPSWLNCLPVEAGQGLVMGNDAIGSLNLHALLRGKAAEFVPEKSSVLGSQWLPELFEVDGGLTFFPAGDAGAEEATAEPVACRFSVAPGEGDVSGWTWLYQLSRPLAAQRVLHDHVS